MHSPPLARTGPLALLEYPSIPIVPNANQNCRVAFRSGSRSYLGSEDGRLDQLERSAVDLDQTLSGLAVGDSLFCVHQKSALPSFDVLVAQFASRWASLVGKRTVAFFFLPKH